jgi:polyphosphate kinase
VTAVVELKARFDEERNISWANRLEKAGVIVVYGLARLKVHTKITMVMRRENGRVRRYVHLSTGNYNDRTAKLYEDIGLFTAREEIAYDAGLLFNMITGYSAIQSMRRLSIAPTALKRRLLELIDREIGRTSAENPGRIMAKLNALSDIAVIDALYRASQAGVRIQLCVRGICRLVPGVPGLSEHIRVVSVVDHYLEHSRIIHFANGGAEEIYLSSADWMPRNLERRVELMFPVQDEALRRELRGILESYFKDNTHARFLLSDGTWQAPALRRGEEPFRVQERLLDSARSSESGRPARQEFIVRRRVDNRRDS